MNKVFQHVSEGTMNNKYAMRDVFVIDVLHSEAAPLFWQIKHIFSIDTLWILCGKMLISLLYDSCIHVYRVKADVEWTSLKAGDELDFQPNVTLLMTFCKSQFNIVCRFSMKWKNQCDNGKYIFIYVT